MMLITMIATPDPSLSRRARTETTIVIRTPAYYRLLRLIGKWLNAGVMEEGIISMRCLTSGLHGRSCRDLPAAQPSFATQMIVRHDGAERSPLWTPEAALLHER